MYQLKWGVKKWNHVIRSRTKQEQDKTGKKWAFMSEQKESSEKEWKKSWVGNKVEVCLRNPGAVWKMGDQSFQTF